MEDSLKPPVLWRTFSWSCQVLSELTETLPPPMRSSGKKPLVCEAMDRIAHVHPDATVWRGSRRSSRGGGTNRFFCSASHKCPTCCQLGCCSSTVLQLSVGATFCGVQNAFFGIQIFFWDTKIFFWDTKIFFWDTGIQVFFFGNQKFLVDQNHKTSQKFQQNQK